MNWIVFDVETTGLSPKTGDRVIEIGAVAMQGSNIVKEFHSLVDSGHPISWQAQQVHGISDRMLRGAPSPGEVFTDFRRFIDSSPLVAHNAPFDIRFLRAEFAQLGHGLFNQSHCTLQLTRRHWPQWSNHRLGTVYEMLGGVADPDRRRHRALDDARMAAHVWSELLKAGKVG